MNSQIKSNRERKYFIDWLRIGLIISVFFYHLGMIFRPENWHVNSKVPFEFLEPIMWWMSLWRMPLLFLVSGVGTYYAIGHRTSWQYLKERFKRLFIPLLFGFFTLVPLMVYVERIDNYTSFLNFIPHMFDGGPYPVGNFSWHHLWFIAYLFVISLLITPFLNYTKSGHYNMVRGKLIAIFSRKMGLNWLLPIIIISQLILRDYFPKSTHALYNDWAYFTYYVIFFISGFMLFTSPKVIRALARDRRLFLYQTIGFTVLYYTTIYMVENSVVRHYLYLGTSLTLAWSCGLTAIGYFKRYFNNDHKYRAVMNEAIYPFYLLHQPALIFVGYVVLKWEVSYGMQALLITLITLVSIIITYWFIIRPFSFLRIAFGLKRNKKKEISKIVNLESSIAFDK